MRDPGRRHDEAPATGADPWLIERSEPTNLIAPWPDERPPTQCEIMSALSAWRGDEVTWVEDLPTESEELAWCSVIRVAGLNAPIVMWSEPSRVMPAEELPGGVLDRCAWIVGFETLLTREDPLTDFISLVRLTGCALRDVPAILDVNTTMWHDRRALDEVFASKEVEPPADVLWVIQAVQSSNDASDPASNVWLHTHGLWRCGVPELEMIGVPLARASAAAELINDVAALVLEQGPVAPGAAFDVGTDLSVQLRPWQDVVSTIHPENPGGLIDRERGGADAHKGVRAVICAMGAAEADERARWEWPSDVIERLMQDEAGVYMTRRATERQARLAQLSWGQLATAFACAAKLPLDAEGRALAVFGIKAGFEKDKDAECREHVWFEGLQFDGDRFEGTLVNQPLGIEGLNRGDRMWVHRDQVSDWRVMTALGAFTPNDVDALWRAIDELRRSVDSDAEES